VVPLGPDGTALKPMEYDGIAVFRIRSMEKWEAAFQSHYYQEKVKPDEDILLDRVCMNGVLVQHMGTEVKIH